MRQAFLSFRPGVEREQIVNYLFQEAETQEVKLSQIAQDMQRLIEINPNLPLVSKLNLFTELVRGYPSNNTFLPTKAVKTREFECAIKTLLLGKILQKHLGSEVYIFGVHRPAHIELGIIERFPKEGEEAHAWGINANTRFKSDPKKTTETTEQPPIVIEEGIPEEYTFTLPIGLNEFTPQGRHDDSFSQVEDITSPQFLSLLRLSTIYYNNPHAPILQTPIQDGEIGSPLGVGPWESMAKAAIQDNIMATIPHTSEMNDFLTLFYQNSSLVQNTRGHIWATRGWVAKRNTESYLAYFKKSISLDPTWANGYIQYATSLTDQTQQIDILREGLSINPTDQSLWFSLGSVYENNRDMNMARQCLRKALILEPTDTLAWYNLAMSYTPDFQVPISREELEEAVVSWERVISLPDTNHEKYVEMAQRQLLYLQTVRRDLESPNIQTKE